MRRRVYSSSPLSRSNCNSFSQYLKPEGEFLVDVTIDDGDVAGLLCFVVAAVLGFRASALAGGGVGVKAVEAEGGIDFFIDAPELPLLSLFGTRFFVGTVGSDDEIGGGGSAAAFAG